MSAETVFNSIPDVAYDGDVPECDPDAFARVVEARRSVRVFDGTPVPEEVVRACLDLALLAPNSSNLQPWEFHWVRSPEAKAALVKACMGQPAAATAAELIVAVARTKTWKVHARQMLAHFAGLPKPAPKAAVDYYAKLAPVAYGRGPLGVLGPLKKLVLTGIGLFRPMPRGPASRADMRVWAVKSTALACENLMLAFRAYGFDTCPMEGLDERRVARLLALPRDAHVVMAISAGKRDPKGVYGQRVRFPTEQFVKEI